MTSNPVEGTAASGFRVGGSRMLKRVKTDWPGRGTRKLKTAAPFIFPGDFLL